MKMIFLDTNFILDYFVREEYSSDAERLLVLGKDCLKFYISYLTVANFAYIVGKMPRETVCSLPHKIKNAPQVCSLTTRLRSLLSLRV